MQTFTTVTAVAAPFDAINIDTDQLLPGRYLRKPRGEDYPGYLFRDLRYDETGDERPDFILNTPSYRNARIFVGNRNFGCGSSREAAVFALDANGIRAVIAPSFGDIFFNNCFSNGILPVRLDDEVVAGLRAQLHASPGATMTVDLEAQLITSPDGTAHAFEVEPFRRHCLLNGLDDILLTFEREAEMQAFEARHRAETPWLFSG